MELGNLVGASLDSTSSSATLALTLTELVSGIVFMTSALLAFLSVCMYPYVLCGCGYIQQRYSAQSVSASYDGTAVVLKVDGGAVRDIGDRNVITSSVTCSEMGTYLLRCSSVLVIL